MAPSRSSSRARTSTGRTWPPRRAGPHAAERVSPAGAGAVGRGDRRCRISGSGSWPSQTMTVAPRSSIAAAEAAATATVDAGDADELTRFAEIGTWFVIVGAAMARARLPAALVARRHRLASLGGYLDRWGLASPTHVVVLLAALAILALADHAHEGPRLAVGRRVRARAGRDARRPDLAVPVRPARRRRRRRRRRSRRRGAPHRSAASRRRATRHVEVEPVV